MLSIILEFDVLDGKDDEFIAAWTECTEVIYKNFGSLGSRLHKSENGSYVAYAQWPNETIYNNSSEWPAPLIKYRDKMRTLLKNGRPRVLHKLKVEVDLLKNTTHNNS